MARKENPVPAGELAALPIGARMRLERQRHGRSLATMADRLGYTKGHLSAVENCIVRPSRQLVAAYERELDLPLGVLLDVYEREQGRLAGAPRSQRSGLIDPPATTPSLDAEINAIFAALNLSASERGLLRQLVLEEARAKAESLRASLDWWAEPGPVPVGCIPLAGWQWREWSRDEIVAAVDRAAAEAMKARVRELVVVLPPHEIPEMERAFQRPSFAQRLQRITCVGQSQPLGLGHAILQAEPLIGGRPFAVLLPDNHFGHYGSESAVLQQLVDHFAAQQTSLLAVARLKVNRRHYGLARLRPAADSPALRPVALLAEKPDPHHPIYRCEPPCDPGAVYAVLGRYVLSPAALTALAALQRARRDGQPLELSDALQWLIDQGQEEIAAYELPSLVQLDRHQTVFVANHPSDQNRPLAA